MYKALLSLAIICLFFSCSGKRKKADLTVSADVKIQLVDSVVDFGDITAIQPLPKHTFVLKNIGTKPLVLTDVHPSCGCITLSNYTRKPIQPGDKGIIMVAFDPKSQTKGVFSKSIIVHSNAINYVELTVKGNNMIAK